MVASGWRTGVAPALDDQRRVQATTWPDAPPCKHLAGRCVGLVHIVAQLTPEGLTDPGALGHTCHVIDAVLELDAPVKARGVQKVRATRPDVAGATKAQLGSATVRLFDVGDFLFSVARGTQPLRTGDGAPRLFDDGVPSDGSVTLGADSFAMFVRRSSPGQGLPSAGTRATPSALFSHALSASLVGCVFAVNVPALSRLCCDLQTRARRCAPRRCGGWQTTCWACDRPVGGRSKITRDSSIVSCSARRWRPQHQACSLPVGLPLDYRRCCGPLGIRRSWLTSSISVAFP